MEIARPGAVLPLDEMKRNDEKLSLVIQKMKQMSSMINMLNSMNLAPQAQTMLEQAMSSAAIQFGGLQAFFSSDNVLHDSSTSAKQPEPSLSTRSKTSKKRCSKTKTTRPHAGATMPSSANNSCLKSAYHQPACATMKYQKKGTLNERYQKKLIQHMKYQKKETQHAPLKQDSYFHAFGNWY